MENPGRLTHLTGDGSLQMVDITDKPITQRVAVARGEIGLSAETLKVISEGKVPKGNVFEVARVAGIMATKTTGTLIPLCHPLQITGAEITFEVGSKGIQVEARVSTAGKTGVEMEAMSAVSVSLLTIYDMCKAVDRDMQITNVRLIKKTGGQRGPYIRDEGKRGGP